jgi:hypothetical protein
MSSFIFRERSPMIAHDLIASVLLSHSCMLSGKSTLSFLSDRASPIRSGHVNGVLSTFLASSRGLSHICRTRAPYLGIDTHYAATLRITSQFTPTYSGLRTGSYGCAIDELHGFVAYLGKAGSVMSSRPLRLMLWKEYYAVSSMELVYRRSNRPRIFKSGTVHHGDSRRASGL